MFYKTGQPSWKDVFKLHGSHFSAKDESISHIWVHWRQVNSTSFDKHFRSFQKQREQSIDRRKNYIYSFGLKRPLSSKTINLACVFEWHGSPQKNAKKHQNLFGFNNHAIWSNHRNHQNLCRTNNHPFWSNQRNNPYVLGLNHHTF